MKANSSYGVELYDHFLRSESGLISKSFLASVYFFPYFCYEIISNAAYYWVGESRTILASRKHASSLSSVLF